MDHYQQLEPTLECFGSDRWPSLPREEKIIVLIGNQRFIVALLYLLINDKTMLLYMKKYKRNTKVYFTMQETCLYHQPCIENDIYSKRKKIQKQCIAKLEL
jgi:hypothetical protein